MDRKILGQSKPVLDMIKMIEKVAPTKTNVLIIGESGTGKELVARMIHNAGPLKEKIFIPVNCGAIPETLIESEMFGHKKGSFTGAVSDKVGLFEAANGGTLFLDEVGELPLSMQVKLLRALQDRTVRRVGDTEDRKIDVRIISATNKDLEQGTKQGTFREDLFYRLNVIQIKTPPLRDRGEDIVLLAKTFLKNFSEKYSRSFTGYSDEALELIRNYSWPGNVRELENVVQRAVTLGQGEIVGISVFPPQMLKGTHVPVQSATGGTQSLELPDFSSGPIVLDRYLESVIQRVLESALSHSDGDKKKAASLVGLTQKDFQQKLAKK